MAADIILFMVSGYDGSGTIKYLLFLRLFLENILTLSCSSLTMSSNVSSNTLWWKSGRDLLWETMIVTKFDFVLINKWKCLVSFYKCSKFLENWLNIYFTGFFNWKIIFVTIVINRWKNSERCLFVFGFKVNTFS